MIDVSINLMIILSNPATRSYYLFPTAPKLHY